MKEVKFRVYVKRCPNETDEYHFFGKIMNVSSIEFLKGYLTVYYEPLYTNVRPVPIDKYYFKSFGFDEVELMQYSGFQDDSDNDIYEGDILKLGQTIFEICVGNGSFIIKALNGDQVDMLCESLVVLKPIKIIGNIYQNPKLSHTYTGPF